MSKTGRIYITKIIKNITINIFFLQKYIPRIKQQNDRRDDLSYVLFFPDDGLCYINRKLDNVNLF